MNEEFRKQRARAVRTIADKADPFTKKRLLDLADRYELAPRPVTPIPAIGISPNDKEAGHTGDSSAVPAASGS